MQGKPTLYTSLLGGPMAVLSDIVRQFFKDDEWIVAEENGIFTGGVNISNKLKDFRIVIDTTDNDLFMMYALIGQRASEAYYGQVAEFIARANFGLKLGNFEFDFNDGEVRYKLSSYVSAEGWNNDEVRRMIVTVYAMLERYGDQLLATMLGFATAQEAVALAEAPATNAEMPTGEA